MHYAVNLCEQNYVNKKLKFIQHFFISNYMYVHEEISLIQLEST